MDVRRSSTDQLTNVVLLAGTRIEEDLSPLLRLGDAPERLLPTFLHEATHHWANNTAVGLALAVVKMRMQEAAVEFHRSKDRLAEDRLVRSLGRYEVAVSLLRPLEEGLALYAEFDITSRQASRMWSEPLQLAATFFRRPVADPRLVGGELFVTAWAQAVVQTLRFSEEALARKVDVLGRPLDPTRDPYLTGYLLVRRLWLLAARREWRLASETDLFFAYLGSFIHEDMGLVAALLNDDLDEIRGTGAVANRILMRLQAFIDCDLSAALARFEEIVSADQPDEERRQLVWTTVDLTAQEIADGGKRLEEALHSYEAAGESTDLLDRLRAQMQSVLLRRQLLYVGSWPVEVEVRGGRFAIDSGGTRIREGVARPGTPDGRGDGLAEVLQWIPRRERVCAVVRDGVLVATQSMLSGEDNSDEVASLIARRDEARELLQSIEGVVDAVSQVTIVPILRDKIRAFVSGAMQQYIGIALADVADERLAATIEAMNEYGFHAVLDYDRQAIEAFAALGLSCSVSPSESFAAAFLERRGLSLERALAAGDQLHERYSVGRVRRDRGVLLPSV